MSMTAIAAVDEGGKRVSKDYRDHSEDIIKIYEKDIKHSYALRRISSELRR